MGYKVKHVTCGMRSYQAVVVLSHSWIEDKFQCMNIDFVISHILSLDWTAGIS